MRLVIVAAVAALGLGACDSGEENLTAVQRAAQSRPAATAPAPAAQPAASGALGLTVPFASEADWVAACTAVPLHEDVCGCAGKAVSATLGAEAFYAWVWEAYVERNSIAHTRSVRWMDEKGLDEAARKNFTDEIGKCYVRQ